VCNKSFEHPAYLALHRQTHNVDRPYACELCNKTFRTNCNLGAHRKLKHLNQQEEGKICLLEMVVVNKGDSVIIT
jgi:hypothetical protein